MLPCQVSTRTVSRNLSGSGFTLNSLFRHHQLAERQSHEQRRVNGFGPVVCLPGPRVVVLLILVEAEIVGERFDAVALEQ